MRVMLSLLLILSSPALRAQGADEQPAMVTNRALPTGVTSTETTAQPAPVITNGATLPLTQTNNDNSSLMAVCGNALASVASTFMNLRKKTDEELERQGYQPIEDLYTGARDEVVRNIRANMSGGCSNFIDKDGNFGPWAHATI